MRQPKIPKEISALLGSFSLSRTAIVVVLTRIHSEFGALYAQNRMNRVKGHEDRRYWHRMVVQDGDRLNVLAFVVDDATSPDDLIIVDEE